MTLKWSITGNAMIGQIVGLSLILFLVVFRPFLSMRGSCMRAQNLNFVVYTTYESLYCIPAFKMTRNPMVWSILSINQYFIVPLLVAKAFKYILDHRSTITLVPTSTHALDANSIWTLGDVYKLSNLDLYACIIIMQLASCTSS